MAAQLITNATVNITGMYTFFQYVNEVTETWFFVMVLFALLIILFVVFKASSYSNSKPFAAASFIVMVMSIIFRTLELMDNQWMYVFITFTAISAVWMYLENSQS